MLCLFLVTTTIRTSQLLSKSVTALSFLVKRCISTPISSQLTLFSSQISNIQHIYLRLLYQLERISRVKHRFFKRMLRLQSLFFFMITFISNINLLAATQTGALDTKESDHLALLAIKSKIVIDPEGFLSSWNNSINFCQWEGVTCGRRHRRVTALDLSSRGLAGSLSPFVGNLSFLRMIKLYNNTLEGIIPPEIGRLFRLEQLRLTNNSFHGNVPATLSNCTNLKGLYLGRNKLVGMILQEVSSLLKLVELVVHANKFRGEIPPSIGNLTSLQVISAHGNQFRGSIPYAIGQLKKLWVFAFGGNQLNGKIPPSIYNLSLLSVMDIGINQVSGSLPPDIGLKLPKLQFFSIVQNQFTGVLPISISNCSEMQYFYVGLNYFHGKIAIDFGKMPNLLWVLLRDNVFGSGEPDELNFIASLVNCSNLQHLDFGGNQLRGQLPMNVGNLSTQLSRLKLAYNSIYGSIPTSITSLVGLENLVLDHNQFKGTILSNIGNLQNLKILYLQRNSLSGHIPESVGNLSLLIKLSLSSNVLEGKIPTTIGNCQQLIQLEISENNLTGTIPRELLRLPSLSISLNLSRNHLSGSLPPEIGKLHSLSQLDLSENGLGGEVPSSIGGCNSLENLRLEGNFFHGFMPSTFGSLTGIQYLDLSRNNFSGEVPKFLEKFSLNYLNLSFNDFEGELPINGVFTNATAISVAGNSRLCGGLPELQLSKCSVEDGKTGKNISLALIIVIPIGCLLVGLALVSYWLLLRHKRRSKTQPSNLVLKQSFMKYSYKTLLKATNGFSIENLIGMGGLSRVYKGVLEEGGATFVVKVLNLDLRGASKSFMAECEAWRNIRHRNLVKIITACSSVDFQGNDFKALVYEFMPNGSLEKWLHPTPEIENGERRLSLLQRINIATDVAHAIDYLHHRGEIPIIHCDLKPSNILLDEDMVAHVADFGLARFLLPEVSSIAQSSSIGLRGTIGYAPPEYGLGNDMSAEGDVYSFGILLLEMMIGKRPTESMFENGLSLHNYARKALPDFITNIVDPILVMQEENEAHNPTYAKQRMECMVSVVKIGIACSLEKARDRMNISEVVVELQRNTNIILQHEIAVAG